MRGPRYAVTVPAVRRVEIKRERRMGGRMRRSLTWAGMRPISVCGLVWLSQLRSMCSAIEAFRARKG